jgi:hypothetical protein
VAEILYASVASATRKKPKQCCLGLFELPQRKLLSRAAGVSGDGPISFRGRFACTNYGILPCSESAWTSHEGLAFRLAASITSREVIRFDSIRGEYARPSIRKAPLLGAAISLRSQTFLNPAAMGSDNPTPPSTNAGNSTAEG